MTPGSTLEPGGCARTQEPSSRSWLGLTPTLVSGSAYQAAAIVMGRAAAALASILVARALGLVGFGELAIIQSTLTAGGVIANFGLSAAATKNVSHALAVDRQAVGPVVVSCSVAAFLTGALTGILVFAVAPWLTLHLLARPDLAPSLRIAAPVLLTATLQSVLVGVLLGAGEVRVAAGVTGAAGVAGAGFLAVGASAWGLRGAVAGITLSGILEVLATAAIVRTVLRRQGIAARRRDAFRQWPALWRLSLPLHVANVLTTPTVWICQAIIARGPRGYHEIGLFNAASQWRTVAYVIPGILATLSLPVLSQRWGSGQHREAIRLARRVTFLAFSATLTVGGALTLAAGLIMAAYGSAFRRGWILIPLIMLVAGFTAVGHSASQLLIARGRVAPLPYAAALWALLALGLTHAWRSRGAAGLLLALLVAYGIHSVIIASLALRRARAGPATEAAGASDT